MKFQALGLPETLCQVLEQNQLTEPTAVQNAAIPIVLTGRDLLSSARTGSGKTLAYALPVITRLVANPQQAALVLVPTREIGVQVQQVMQEYLKAVGLQPATLIIGGVSFGPQIMSLRRNPSVIIATPGRLNDHLAQGKLRLNHVQALVLDEADRMLDMGFLPQVRQILRHLRAERQTLLFSATMPTDLARACKEMLRDPERVSVDAPNAANVAIEQRMLEVAGDGKNNALLETLNEAKESVLVFARTKRRTDRVAQYLEQYGVRAERIHGDRSQAQRQKAIDQFRSGKVKVLVATDIAARGLDIPLVELVVNYDLPEAREDYVHRIGRTGRAGATGVAISFVAPEERGHWASLSRQKKDGSAETESSGPRSRTSPLRPGSASREKSFSRPARPSREARPFREERPTREARPFRDERPTREARPFRDERPARQERSQPVMAASAPSTEEWSNHSAKRPEIKARPSRPMGAGAPRAFDGTQRGDRSGSREQRPAGRFQRWGQPRSPREGGAFGSRPANPKHIFTGREGDEQRSRPQRPGRFGGGSAPSGGRKFDNGPAGKPPGRYLGV